VYIIQNSEEFVKCSKDLAFVAKLARLRRLLLGFTGSIPAACYAKNNMCGQLIFRAFWDYDCLQKKR